MPDLKLRKFPDPILRKKAAYISKVGDSEREVLCKMAELMYLNNGVGLAAEQVGIEKQLAVIDVGKGLVKLINPLIVKKKGYEFEEESCLSVPDTIVKIKRAKTIVVSFLNENGETCQISAEGLFARVIQHEIDHLSGRLIVDYLNPIKRLFLSRLR